MKNKISKLLFLMIGSGFVSFTHAEFKEDIPSGKIVTIVAPSNNSPIFFGSYFKNIVEVGMMPSSISPLMGTPKNMPVLDLLKEITPAGWKVKHVGKINIKGNSSWKNGENWVETLDRVAGEFNFSVDLNWDTKTYTIKKVSVKNVQHQHVAPVAVKKPHHHHVAPVVENKVTKNSTVSVINIIENDRVMKKSTPIIVSPVIKVSPVVQSCVNCSVANESWSLLPDLSLRENMEEWSRAAGWKLVWNAVDYPVDVLTHLSGGFASDNGPIKQLSIAYKDAKRPLVFNFKEGNKTLLVINYEFEQTLIKDTNTEVK